MRVSNKDNLLILIFSISIIFYFHFLFINFNRTIIANPEVELIAVYHALLFNNGFAESYDHPGYPFFLLFSFLIKFLNIINILEIGSLSEAFEYQLFGEEFKKIFYTLRILNLFIHILTIYFILKIFDNYRIDRLIKYTIIIIIHLIPNINFLYFVNTTIAHGLFLLILGIYFLSKEKKSNTNFFFFCLLLMSSILSKIQFLPYLFLFPALFLFLKIITPEELYIKKKNFSFTSIKRGLGIFLLFLSIYIVLNDLIVMESFSIFHILVIFYFASLAISFYFLNKNKRDFYNKISLIGCAFFLIIILMGIRYIPNNIRIIYDPLFSNSGFFLERGLLSFDFKIILDLLINSYNIYFLNVIPSKIYVLINIKPYYIFINFILFYGIYKKDNILIFITIGSILSILSISLFNSAVRDLGLWHYAVFTDLVCIGLVIYFFNNSKLKIFWKKYLIITLFLSTIFINYNVINKNISFRDSKFDISLSNQDNLKEYCARKSYLIRNQIQYKSFSKKIVKSYDSYKNIKKKSDNWFFSICNTDLK
jgi:hypothetical protein